MVHEIHLPATDFDFPKKVFLSGPFFARFPHIPERTYEITLN
jgi:hypothetical protein